MKGNEMIYVIPLREVYEKPRKRRAPRAIKEIKKFVKRHAKIVNVNLVKISTAVNDIIWRRSIEKPPREVRVKLVKEAPYVYVLLPEQKLEDIKPKSKEEEKKKEEKKEKKEERTSKEKKDDEGKKEEKLKEHKHEKEEKTENKKEKETKAKESKESEKKN